MTKSDLMHSWDQIGCDRRLSLAMANDHVERVGNDGPAYLLDEYHALATGGTSGERAVMVWDFEGFRLVGSRPPAWGLSVSQHMGVESPFPLVVANVGSVGASHVGGALTRCFSNPAMTKTIPIAASRPIEEIVAELESLQPHILGGYASNLHELAERKAVGELHIAPIGVVAIGSSTLDLPRLEQDLTTALRKAGLPDPRIRVSALTSIDRHPRSHKLKRFIPVGAGNSVVSL